MNASHTYGFVLLAAGCSSRMGKPKALLPYRGTTLIGHTLNAMQAFSYPIIVVTGAHTALLQEALKDTEVMLVHNRDWAEGMASSIRCGLESLLMRAAVSGVILASCDQPAVNAELFKNVIQKKETSGKPIIASAYSDTVGIPALFDCSYFPSLLKLSGEKGAKILMKQNENDVLSVPFPMGEIDIDTGRDYAQWLHAQG